MDGRSNRASKSKAFSVQERPLRSNPLEPDYYRQFPEIFDGRRFRLPEDVAHQLTNSELRSLRKLEMGKTLSPKDADIILSLVEKIRRHRRTLELSDEEMLKHVAVIQGHVQKANRENPGPWGETSFYNMRRMVRAYAEMNSLNLATLLEEALSRKLISLEEFSELVYNLMNARKHLKVGDKVRLVDGSHLWITGTEPFPPQGSNLRRQGEGGGALTPL
ncbi:hypothetical protein [Thermococcus sp. GR6]|uniref:hypothetical protein n=1 Tax=Thermococcus sp. GR6 TaxID=1638256 RepID=UPI001431F208|nr:hypothetical protein [Thermococcus sp. GR6]NJE42908.1 hypothetical protein [Thermococcus sp. GR6]